MSKTLVIAEKPSVGRDLVRVLPGAFTKGEGYLEGPEHVVTWAVGHLVQLADPDEYDDKLQEVADGRPADRARPLQARGSRRALEEADERRQAACSAATTSTRVVNACDAGREGELIFAYLYEKAGSKQAGRAAVAELDDQDRDPETAFGELRPASELASLEAAARSRSEADWIVGMNATRAATIRLRSSFDGAVSLGRVQTPTLAILARREEEIRAFKPEPYWVVDAAVRAGRTSPPGAPTRAATTPAPTRGCKTAEEASAIVDACQRPGGRRSPSSRSQSARSAPPLLYDLTSLQRDANGRYGFTARRTLAAAQRLYEEHKALTYPRTNSRYLTGDMIPEIKPIARLVGERSRVPRRHRNTCSGSTCCRSGAWSTTPRSPTTTRSSRPGPSAIRSRR